ncbi:MAG: hypothetical protein IJB22_03785, partial [Clostridia bacterium]|nr:hypothetical protein [Clostridia bacterium]
AGLSMLRADDVVDALVGYAQEHEVGLIILGAAGPTGSSKEPIPIRLQRKLPGVEFDIVAPN